MNLGVVQSNREERNTKRASLCYLVMDLLDFISTNCVVYLRCAEFIGATSRMFVCMWGIYWCEFSPNSH